MYLAASKGVSSFYVREKLVKLTVRQEPVELFEGNVPVLLWYDQVPCERAKLLWAMDLRPELPPGLPSVLLERVVLYTGKESSRLLALLFAKLVRLRPLASAEFSAREADCAE